MVMVKIMYYQYSSAWLFLLLDDIDHMDQILYKGVKVIKTIVKL